MKSKNGSLKSFVRRLYFKVLLAACRQTGLDPYFTERNYPLADDGTKGPVEEYGFGRDIRGYDAIKKLQEMGFKLVGTKRAMQYVATHGHAQLAHPLVVLGDQWEYRCYDFYVPVFCKSSIRGTRMVDVCNLDVDFLPCCRFLVSRE